jgi:hypothetical protein
VAQVTGRPAVPHRDEVAMGVSLNPVGRTAAFNNLKGPTGAGSMESLDSTKSSTLSFGSTGSAGEMVWQHCRPNTRVLVFFCGVPSFVVIHFLFSFVVFDYKKFSSLSNPQVLFTFFSVSWRKGSSILYNFSVAQNLHKSLIFYITSSTLCRGTIVYF